MTTAMASHPLYWSFTEPGFRGRFAILDRNEAIYHVKIWEATEAGETPADDEVMELLWTLPTVLDAWNGSFQTWQKNYSTRTCVLRCSPDGSNADITAIWLLDREPTSLHE